MALSKLNPVFTTRRLATDHHYYVMETEDEAMVLNNKAPAVSLSSGT